MLRFHIVTLTAVLLLAAGALALEAPADSAPVSDSAAASAPADTAAVPDSTAASAPSDSVSISDSAAASAPADSAASPDSAVASTPADSAISPDSATVSAPADSVAGTDSTVAADTAAAPDTVTQEAEAGDTLPETAPVRPKKKYALFFHPLSFFPSGTVRGTAFPAGFWLTHERALRRNRAMIARVGYALDHTTEHSSDDFGDIDLTARGLDLQIGLRQYARKPWNMAFLEAVVNVKAFDYDYRAYRQGGLIDNARTSVVYAGALGYAGLKKRFEDFICYVSLGAGYGYIIPGDKSLVLEYGGGEKSIEPGGEILLIDFNLGIGFSY